MADNIFYFYVGHSDAPHGPWKFIPDTAEDRQKAVQNGYTAGSTMSFAFEPQEGKPEPVRRGPLILDFDCKADPAKAIDSAREVVTYLFNRYGVNPESLRYWLSGGKGCHIEIPAVLYSGEGGEPFLPKLHRYMLQLMDLWYQPLSHIIDQQFYCMGKGKLLRWANLKRPNGRYKVPVSVGEFFDLDYQSLVQLTEEARHGFEPEPVPSQPSEALTRVYELALELLRIATAPGSTAAGMESLLACTFIRHCYRDQADLPEPHWWAMISIMAKLGEVGCDLIHEFSQGHPKYNVSETDRKIRQARQNNKPVSCDFIRGLYDCGRKCQVRSPADLWRFQKSAKHLQAVRFELRPDGVYFIGSDNDEEKEMKICSPLKILGQMRNPDGGEWARLVEIQTSDGTDKKLCVYMKDTAGRDHVRALLLDNGLEINHSSRVGGLLMEYIQSGGPDDSFFLCLNQVGWLKDAYILPDVHFGPELTEKIHFVSDAVDNYHNCAGSLEEWQEQLGQYCRGNSLLVLLTCYALTGPLLKRCGLEGGGLHVFGSSSSGKTTMALVAGSVCGGGGQRGFLRQWRATHNALESTASLHNDNFLILDEISQALGETVSQVAYMLANGQGRDRLKADASRRKTYRWLLNFLSTGEVTINDKIEENGKHTALTGQEVRVIDLPVRAGSELNAFQDLHGLPDGGVFSETIARNACRYYGSPLREFLKHLCADVQANDETLIHHMNTFVADVCPSGASGQVKRVARKFALIAAAGKMAVSFGVLPYADNEPWQAAASWFKIWLDNRNGIGEQEITKALSRIMDHFDLYSANRYTDARSERRPIINNHAGYFWDKGDDRYYLMFSPIFDELIKGVNRKALISELDKLGWLVHTRTGKIMHTKEVDQNTVRGVIFRPSAWKGKPEKETIARQPLKTYKNAVVF